MKKVIVSAHVRTGDVLQMPIEGGSSHRVVVAGVEATGKRVRLKLVPPPETDIGPFWAAGSPDEEFILVHRPWPEGKTEADMLDAVETAIRKCVQAEIENDGRSIGAYASLWRSRWLSDELRALREAIEAYELGKPEATS